MFTLYLRIFFQLVQNSDKNINITINFNKMMDLNRFVTDRAYAVGKALYLGVILMCLLATFVATKIVTEVIAWADGDDTYPSNVISVTGEGEAVAVPDVAEFSFSVNEKRSFSRSCTNRCNSKNERCN
jgi:hypothetical protein